MSTQASEPVDNPCRRHTVAHSPLRTWACTSTLPPVSESDCSRLRDPHIGRDQCEPQRPKVVVEREHVIDMVLVGRDGCHVVYERDLLVVEPFELVHDGVDGLPARMEDANGVGTTDTSDRPECLVVADLSDDECRQFAEDVPGGVQWL